MTPPDPTDPREALRVALDNLATHHTLERVAGGTHSRPDRCEFVDQARVALAASPAPEPPSKGLDAATRKIIKRHHRQENYAGRQEPNKTNHYTGMVHVCVSCHQPWPCDASILAVRLREQPR